LSFVKHISLIIIVLVFIVLATLYSVVTPLGEGPDEPGHARYMFFLAREGRLPVQRADAASSDAPGEGHQPPLAYALVAPLAAWLPVEDRQFDLPGNPRFTWATPSTGTAELNAVAHGSREYMPWRGFVLAWHLARLVSVALGAATVALTYLASRALTSERPKTKDESLRSPFVLRPSSFVPLLAAALVAFNPQFLFISALVTNDALLVTLSAALLWLGGRGRGWGFGVGEMGNGSSPILSPIKYAAVIGTVLGLALITKQSAIILAPVAFLTVLERSWLAERMRQADGHKAILSSCHLVALSIFAATTLLVSGWWYARNWRLYGDLLGLAAFQAEFITQRFDATSAAAWIAALAQLHDSFWARFGWMNVTPPGWVIGIFATFEAGALIGWLLAWRRGNKEPRKQGGKEANREEISSAPLLLVPLSFHRLANGRWPLLALPLLAFGWLVSFALTAGLVAWQGRLLFPALPAIAILLAAGIENVKLKIENHPAYRVNFTFYILHFTFCALALWLPFGAIQPAYPSHTLPESVALERLGTQVYGRFGLASDPGAELRGWTLSGSTRAGDTPELALIWHALGRQNRNWTVFVHLVDAQGQIVAEDNRPPQNDAFPMLQWVAGDWIEDRHPLALPANLAPGEYHIRVGLFFPRTERRAGVYSKRGTLRGDYLDVGSMIVATGGGS
jgi:4-amino-4-deoxy-L-arabinose transferase-like glycosyltransferase